MNKKSFSYLQLIPLAIFFISAAQLALSLYLPSLPAIAKELHVLPGTVEWTLAIFLISYGGSQLFYGPLSDIYGRKPLLLIGLSILACGSFLIIFAKSFFLLFIARFIQGVGAGSANALSRASIRDNFEKEKLTAALSILVLGISITPMIAPFIGGHLQHRFGWHATFIFQTIYVLIVLFSVILKFPETNEKPKTIIQEKQKILRGYVFLLKNKEYIAYTFLLFFAFGSYALALCIAPFIYQTTLGLNAAQYGNIILIPASGLICGSLAIKFLHHKMNNTLFAFAGMLFISFAGLLILLMHTLHIFSASLMTFFLFLVFIGIGLLFTSVTANALGPIPSSKAGTASAVLGFMQMSGAALSTSIASIFHFISPTSLGGCLLSFGCFMIFIYFIFIKKKAKQKTNL